MLQKKKEKKKFLFKEQVECKGRTFLMMKAFKNSVAGQLQFNLEQLQDKPERMEKVLKNINVQNFMEDISGQLSDLRDQTNPYMLSHLDLTSIAIFEEERR